jgi:hypothetical protein
MCLQAKLEKTDNNDVTKRELTGRKKNYFNLI